MVKYYGRARQRIGSVNTNQLGLKMSGCPSRVGRSGRIDRYIGSRVNCMMGFCRPVLYHGIWWRTSMRNKKPFCKPGVSKCLAAAGGIGNINTPYYRIPGHGEKGCGPGRWDDIKKETEFILKTGNSVVDNDRGTWFNPTDPPIPGQSGGTDPEHIFGLYIPRIIMQSDKDAPVGTGAFQIDLNGSNENIARFNKVTVTDITGDIYYGRTFTINLCHQCSPPSDPTKSCQYVAHPNGEVAKISFSLKDYRIYKFSFTRGASPICPLHG